MRKRITKRPDGSTSTDMWVDEGPGDPRFLEPIRQMLDRLGQIQGVPDTSQPPVIGKEFSPEYLQGIQSARARLMRKFDRMFDRILKSEETKHTTSADDTPQHSAETAVPAGSPTDRKADA